MQPTNALLFTNLAFGAKTVDKLALFANAESTIVVALGKLNVEIRVLRNATCGTVVIDEVFIVNSVRETQLSNIPDGIEVRPVRKMVASLNPEHCRNKFPP